MMKKLALIPFMLSMAFAGQSQAALTDGVYETTVNGHNAPMTVKVTIKDHKIAAIDREFPAVSYSRRQEAR